MDIELLLRMGIDSVFGMEIELLSGNINFCLAFRNWLECT